jgi:hypothetical protein
VSHTLASNQDVNQTNGLPSLLNVSFVRSRCAQTECGPFVLSLCAQTGSAIRVRPRAAPCSLLPPAPLCNATFGALATLACLDASWACSACPPWRLACSRSSRCIPTTTCPFGGPTLDKAKPERTTRITCLGGSTTASGYPIDMREILQRRVGLSHRFEVMNLGIGWYTSLHSAVNLRVPRVPVDAAARAKVRHRRADDSHAGPNRPVDPGQGPAGGRTLRTGQASESLTRQHTRLRVVLVLVVHPKKMALSR